MCGRINFCVFFRHCLLCASLIFSGVTLQGCAAFRGTAFPIATIKDTNPTTADPGFTSRRYNDRLLIKYPGLALTAASDVEILGKWMIIVAYPFFIVPVSLHMRKEDIPPLFPLEIRFYPWEANYSFNPMQTVLTTPEVMRQALRPKLFIGPVRVPDLVERGPNKAVAPCVSQGDQSDPPRGNEGSDQPLVARSNTEGPVFHWYGAESVPDGSVTCYSLLFEITWDPDRPMILSIEGLKRGGTEVKVPKMTFEKGSGVQPSK